MIEIRWGAVTALVFMVGAFVIAVVYRDAITRFLGTMQTIGPGHTTDEQVLGLIAFGIIAMLIVAVVRLFRDANSK